MSQASHSGLCRESLVQQPKPCKCCRPWSGFGSPFGLFLSAFSAIVNLSSPAPRLETIPRSYTRDLRVLAGALELPSFSWIRSGMGRALPGLSLHWSPCMRRSTSKIEFEVWRGVDMRTHPLAHSFAAVYSQSRPPGV